jgi:hypothetical protein
MVEHVNTPILATGRKLRVLTIVDTFSRFSPGDRTSVHLPRR